jgi:sarcosine/dimethylglycine N-methyltransferase
MAGLPPMTCSPDAPISVTRVVDLCAGLGGPARYLADRYGADVTGIELTPARVIGAADLTRRVGLAGQVRVLQGDVMDLPLKDSSHDAVVSQEALLHVPDLARTFREAHRVLRPGGRIAFTNWIVHRPLSDAQRQLLWDGMAAATLIGIDGHTELLRGAGFEIEAVEDETEAWGVILAERLRMYKKLRGEAEAAGTPAGHDDFYKSYVLFVDLVQRKAMGGARFTAVKI